MTKALQWTEINSKNFLSFCFFLGGEGGQGGFFIWVCFLVEGDLHFPKLTGFDSHKKLETLLKANGLKQRTLTAMAYYSETLIV